jgi:hypothetical protein
MTFAMSKTTMSDGIPTIEQGGVDASREWAPVPSDRSGRPSAAPQGLPDFHAPLSRRDIGQTAFASALMFGDAMDAVPLDMNTEIGDDQQGVALTLGDLGGTRSPDDFFHSDLILIWGGNPVSTQIPNFHFVTEARYHGATIRRCYGCR